MINISLKAYLFRLRTEQDIDDLDKYLNKSNMDGAAWLNCFYKPLEEHAEFDFKKSDLVAAITVDRGDLYESLRDEGGVTLHSEIYFMRLDDMESYVHDGMVVGWETPVPIPSDEGWPDWAKSQLA